MTILRKSILLFALFFAFYNAVAQDHKPRIGLALSGGAARGLAHIGVLQALEEAGLKPDYITGVSMGSIVGGFYAAGYSADSLAAIFRSENLPQLATDEISEKEVVFDEKKNYRNQMLTIGYRKGKVLSPEGLISGQQISTLMDYYTWPVKTISDFDSLPIPYKAVAADIVNFRPVLLDKGNLPDVMRASMAIPTAFTPVEIGDYLLVDGGVVENFAVKELKDMGADIIIGSYTGMRTLKKEQLRSLTAVLTQTATFSGLSNAEEQMKLVDILITHEFGDITLFDFGKADSLIKLGYQSTLPHIERIKELVTQRPDMASKIKKEVEASKGIRIDSVIISGNEVVTDYYISRKLGILNGDTVTQDYLKDRMTYLYGSFLFKKINYQIKHDGERNLLIIRCMEKAKQWMNASVHYDNYLDFGVNLSYVNRNLLLKNSKISLSTFLANNYRVYANYTAYPGRSASWNSTLGLRMTKDKLPAYLIDNRYIQYKNYETNVFLNFKYQPGYNNSFGIEAEYENVRFRPESYSDTAWTSATFHNLNFNFIYELNNLDSYYFPHRGSEIYLNFSNIYLLNALFDYSGSLRDLIWENQGSIFSDSYYQAMFRSRYYIPLSDKSTLGFRANALITIGDSYANNEYGLVGGFDFINKRSLPFVGFHANEFVTKNAVGAGISYYYHFNNYWQLGALYESYLIENIMDKKVSLFHGMGIELGYKSILGPVKIGFMNGIYSDQHVYKSFKMYISLGFLN